MERCLGRWFAEDADPRCGNAAAVCSECVRALALKWWGGIARHSHGGYANSTCVLCEIGAPAYCPEHALAAVTRQRSALREDGAPIGEPDFALGDAR